MDALWVELLKLAAWAIVGAVAGYVTGRWSAKRRQGRKG